MGIAVKGNPNAMYVMYLAHLAYASSHVLSTNVNSWILGILQCTVYSVPDPVYYMSDLRRRSSGTRQTPMKVMIVGVISFPCSCMFH